VGAEPVVGRAGTDVSPPVVPVGAPVVCEGVVDDVRDGVVLSDDVADEVRDGGVEVVVGAGVVVAARVGVRAGWVTCGPVPPRVVPVAAAGTGSGRTTM
jgi:hypothetical protein